MYVNPFWFGVLMTIVFIIVLMIIIAMVRSRKEDKEEEDIEQKFAILLSEVTGKPYRVITKGDMLVGEPLEDSDADNEQKRDP